jgi:hypothetical protein
MAASSSALMRRSSAFVGFAFGLSGAGFDAASVVGAGAGPGLRAGG